MSSSFDHSRLSLRQRALFFGWRWLAPLWDPLYTLTGAREYVRFFRSARQYRRIPGAEKIRTRDMYPQLHDRTGVHSLDAHYFHVNAWAMRRVVVAKPDRHIDVASQPVLSALLSAVLPVTFLDYRPLPAHLDGLECIGGSILALPFADRSLQSVSCLHVAEHIGLGRYGDDLDPHGTEKAARELARVVAPGGQLLLAVPVGRPRLCFNAHRIHAAESIQSYVSELDLVEYSVVLDGGAFVENQELSVTRDSVYALGMFRFQRA